MGRKKPEVLKKTKPIFYIFCEGKRTEVNYFERLLQENGLPTNGVIGYGIDPKRLLEYGIDKEKTKENKDQVWIVFDKDNIEKDSFNKTIINCINEEIGFAFSNPCFELWLWLHLKDITRNHSTKECTKQFSKDFQSTFGIEYNKTNTICIQKIDTTEKRELAITRAKKLDKAFNSSQNFADHNPNTTVYKLVEKILNNSL